jgi:hypothetical protein
VVAFVGISTTICVLFQLAGVAFVPLKLIWPGSVPKFVPVTVTEVPTRPEEGEMLPILGEGMLKLTPLLAIPLLAVTTTLPLVASAGTEVLILVLLQLVIEATVPLMLTLPLPWVAPKFVPVIVMAVPAVPDAGETVVMAGTGRAVTVIASEVVLNLSVTLWRLPEVFFSKRIPISLSVLDVLKVDVAGQL